jgi:hypothetical protein
MIAATTMLRPPPARIGKLTDNITLPRTIELKKALAAAGGAMFGVFMWLFLLGWFAGHSVMSLLLSMAVFGAVGVLVVSWSPLRGESLARWAGLSASTLRADRVQVDGQKVRAYIGVAPLMYTAAGGVQVFASAVEIVPGTHDDRGVPISAWEMRRALLEAGGIIPSAPSALQGFEQLKDLSGPVERPAQRSRRGHASDTAPPGYQGPPRAPGRGPQGGAPDSHPGWPQGGVHGSQPGWAQRQEPHSGPPHR